MRQQRWFSLLNNEIKFTDSGGLIEISCQEGRGERIEIAVSDTGRTAKRDHAHGQSGQVGDRDDHRPSDEQRT